MSALPGNLFFSKMSDVSLPLFDDVTTEDMESMMQPDDDYM